MAVILQMLANEVIPANMAVFASQPTRDQFVSAKISNMMVNTVKRVNNLELKKFAQNYEPKILNRNSLLRAEKAPSEATFRGQQFLSYDLGQTSAEPIVSAQDAITLYFRTRQPNGLLFYTGW